VILVWAIGRRLVDDAAGLAAAFVTALLPMHVYYSQFVRSYSLMIFLAAAGLWLMIRAVQDDRWRDWAAFLVVAILGAYTHYYFAFFLATSFVVVALLRRSWWVGNKALATYIALGLAAVPLLWFVAGDFQYQKGIREPRPLSMATFGYTYFSFFNGYTFGPSTTELQTMSSTEALRAAAPWLAAVGLVVLVLGYQGARKLNRQRVLPTAISLTLLPVLLVFGLSLAAGLNYNVRFVTWVMIPVAIWLGAGMAAMPNSWTTRLAAVGFILLSATAIYNRHAIPRYQHEDLRAAAAHLQANASPGDTVYVVSGYLSRVLRYYLHGDWTIVELPEPEDGVIEDRSEALDTVSSTVFRQPPGHVCWLIYSRPFHGDPDGHLLEVLFTHLPSFQLAATPANVKIYRLEANQSAIMTVR
jgi:4-amino-4-deoxy-L-arabinose transferase-like glycosyltransferase